MPYQIVVVDDHAMMRDAICALLATDKTIEIVGEAETAEEALRVVESLPHCDAVLLDIELGKRDGLWCARQLKALRPSVAVLIVSMHVDEARVREAYDAGVDGYIVKSARTEDLRTAVRWLMDGRRWFDPAFSDIIIPNPKWAPPRPSQAPATPLSERELQILRLLSEGLTQKQMGVELYLSVNTVKTHQKKLYKKLHVNNGQQAVNEGVRNGLIDNEAR